MTRISGIKATPINVPLDAPYVWTYGLFPGFTQSIIEVETDEGITGIGEAPSAGVADLISAGFANKLVGRDPIDIQGCELACLPPHPGVQSVADFGALSAFGGIEMALWDIRGKLWSRPVYELLGRCGADIGPVHGLLFISREGGRQGWRKLTGGCHRLLRADA